MRRLLLPLLPLALVAQTPAPPAHPAGSMPHAMPMTSAAGAPEPKADQTIAHLGKRVIRYGDFTAWLRVMVGSRADMILKIPTSRTQAMRQYLDLQVLAAKGQKENLQSTKEFQSTLAALRQQAFARVLMDEDRPGSDGQKIKETAENPTDQEMEAYFKANRERYAAPERFTARHILVSVKGAPGAGDRGLTDAEAKARIAKIQEELKAGKKFEDLAKEYSDDPGSKANGGLYKDIPFGRFAKEFEEAVRTQPIGKVGEPVKTTFGYHLILVEARSPKQEADFSQVKDQVRRQMVPERRERLNREFLEQAKKEVGFQEVAPVAPKPAPGAPKPPAPKVP
jgi:parvulin-like peptidyl-prolyl isomerase